jgi:UDP-N-acetylmuramate dehydrogenase
MKSKIRHSEFRAWLSQRDISHDVNLSLSKVTTLGIGSRVEFRVKPRSPEQLVLLAQKMQALDYPFWIHGSGSNVLFHLDQDPYPGVLVVWEPRPHTPFPELKPVNEQRFEVLNVHSGFKKIQLAKACHAFCLPAAVWLFGIPGTLAGGVAMNAGTREGSFSGIVQGLISFDFLTGHALEMDTQPSDFGYRTQGLVPPHHLIARIHFQLEGPLPQKTYAHMLTQARTYRKMTQPLQDPTCGSTFKNPPGDFAARLIEAAGLKGFRIGQAQMSPKHSNFLVNLGGATSLEAFELIQRVSEAVDRAFQVRLEPEVKIVTQFILPK